MLLQLIIAFLPWLLFNIIAPYALNASIIISLLICILFDYKTLMKGFILVWGTLLFFLAMLFSVTFFHNLWVIEHLGILASGTLALIGWLSVILGRPFTRQYAKQQVDPTCWKDPSFLKGTRFITLFWCVIFSINLLVNVVDLYVMNIPHWLANTILYTMIIVGIIFTMNYAKRAREKRE